MDLMCFFAPGFFGILVLSLCILPQYKFEISELGLENNWDVFIIVFISYIVGHIIFFLSDLTDKLIFKLNIFKLKSPSDVDSEIELSQELKITKIILKEQFLKKDSKVIINEEDLLNMKARALRNIIISYIPEAYNRISSFTFRSELCRVISSFSQLTSLIGFTFCLFSLYTKSPLVFKNDSHSIVFYILLLISSYLLIIARMKFWSIAFRLPFSIFIAKYFTINEINDKL